MLYFPVLSFELMCFQLW